MHSAGGCGIARTSGGVGGRLARELLQPCHAVHDAADGCWSGVRVWDAVDVCVSLEQCVEVLAGVVTLNLRSHISE